MAHDQADLSSAVHAVAASVTAITTAALGSYPEVMLDIAVESVRNMVANNPSILSLEKSCTNAFNLYKKTRPPASGESTKRAKAVGREGPHPLLLAVAAKCNYVDVDAEAARKEFTAALKSFRPAATVLEAQVAQGRGGHISTAAAHGPSARKAEIMRQKREAHAGTIQKTQTELENRRAASEAAESSGRAAARAAHVVSEHGGGGGRFQDADFFIRGAKDAGERYADEGYSMNERGHNAISDAVMDLNADDGDGLQQQRRRIMWDKKAHKYVQLQKNESVKAGKRVRTESGASARSAEKSGEIFRKWVKRTGGKADAVKAAKGGQAALADRFEHGGRGWANPVSFKRANAGVKDDIKSEGEMRKTLKRKERQGQHLKSKGGVKKKSAGTAGKKQGRPKGKK